METIDSQRIDHPVHFEEIKETKEPEDNADSYLLEIFYLLEFLFQEYHS